MTDQELAERYFEERILPVLEGLPEDGVRHLRERYVADALANPEAVRQLREIDETLAALGQLDGTTASSVRLLAGLTAEELDELGGVEEP